MLSYRHAFHAGNYADVLKHIVWQQVLLHLNKKDKPYCVIDTHAGAGMYSLASAEAKKTAEYLSGAGRLWNVPGAPELVQEYLAAVCAANNKVLEQGASIDCYPGSPWFSTHYLRDGDRAWFCEVHPQDYPLLQQSLRDFRARPRRVKALKEDGFQALIAKLPPQEKRGAVLIDPSYEIKSDYQRVVDITAKAYKRFATGTYVLWYPVVDRRRIRQMQANLLDSGIRNIYQFELAVKSDARNPQSGEGMTASGVFVINPPWTLAEQLRNTLPWLAQEMGGMEGRWVIEQLVPE